MVGPLTRQSLVGAACIGLWAALFGAASADGAEERRQRWTHPGVSYDQIEFTATPARFPWEVATSSEPIEWPEAGIFASHVRLASDACYRIRARVSDDEIPPQQSELSNPVWVGDCPPPPILLIDVSEPPKAMGMAVVVLTLFGIKSYRMRARQ